MMGTKTRKFRAKDGSVFTRTFTTSDEVKTVPATGLPTKPKKEAEPKPKE